MAKECRRREAVGHLERLADPGRDWGRLVHAHARRAAARTTRAVTTKKRSVGWRRACRVRPPPVVHVAICRPSCYKLPVRTIPQRELRNDNARVIEAVASGESFVVTRNGIPVAELRPIRTARPRFVPKAELVALATAGPHVDLDQFRADLDRSIDQGL